MDLEVFPSLIPVSPHAFHRVPQTPGSSLRQEVVRHEGDERLCSAHFLLWFRPPDRGRVPPTLSGSFCLHEPNLGNPSSMGAALCNTSIRAIASVSAVINGCCLISYLTSGAHPFE